MTIKKNKSISGSTIDLISYQVALNLRRSKMASNTMYNTQTTGTFFKALNYKGRFVGFIQGDTREEAIANTQQYRQDHNGFIPFGQVIKG